MASWGRAARALLSLNGCRTQAVEICKQQTRNMGGGGGGAPWHHAYNGKVPPEFQGPAFQTYGGLTLPKPVKDYDYWLAKGLGGVFWFTMLYHGYVNWEEHWLGELYLFEKDVQLNGWEDEGHGHGHGHH